MEYFMIENQKFENCDSFTFSHEKYEVAATVNTAAITFPEYVTVNTETDSTKIEISTEDESLVGYQAFQLKVTLDTGYTGIVYVTL